MMELAKPISVAKLRRARAPFVFDLGPVPLVFATITLVSMTSMLYLTQASSVAATGYDISALEERRAVLRRDQEQLLVQVARLQALGQVESQATGKLGMVPASQPEYLRVRPPAVDVEAAVKQAERQARHQPATWRERLALALLLRSAG